MKRFEGLAYASPLLYSRSPSSFINCDRPDANRGGKSELLIRRKVANGNRTECRRIMKVVRADIQ